MQLRERTYNKCKCCKQRTTLKKEEAYGCDNCGNEIDINKKGEAYLEAVVFNKIEDSTSSERKQYCSWRCCLLDLKKMESNYFVTLPYLHYDAGNIHAREFFKLLKEKL